MKNLTIDLPFPGEKFKEIWDEWIAFRKEHRFKTYKPIGLKHTFTNLVTISNNDENTAIEIIKHSMAQPWQGLFPLKIKNGTNIKSSQQGNYKGKSAGAYELLDDIRPGSSDE